MAVRAARELNWEPSGAGGGGGGGGGISSRAGHGWQGWRLGGLYGGGGGGGGYLGGPEQKFMGSGGNGAPGVIVIVYTPVVRGASALMVGV